MQVIKKDHRTVADRFTAMLREWLMSSSNPTWSQLVQALRLPSLNHSDIAAEIEDNYIKSDDSSVQESKDTESSSEYDNTCMHEYSESPETCLINTVDALQYHDFTAPPGFSTLQGARMEAALWDARAKWFELGLALNLSEKTLEVIDQCMLA